MNYGTIFQSKLIFSKTQFEKFLTIFTSPDFDKVVHSCMDATSKIFRDQVTGFFLPETNDKVSEITEEKKVILARAIPIVSKISQAVLSENYNPYIEVLILFQQLSTVM